jgi:hypothetical protein
VGIASFLVQQRPGHSRHPSREDIENAVAVWLDLGMIHQRWSQVSNVMVGILVAAVLNLEPIPIGGLPRSVTATPGSEANVIAQGVPLGVVMADEDPTVPWYAPLDAKPPPPRKDARRSTISGVRQS